MLGESDIRSHKTFNNKRAESIKPASPIMECRKSKEIRNVYPFTSMPSHRIIKMYLDVTE